jgi:ribulose-phosphate 3-epimerase
VSILIAPSLLSADFARLADEVEDVQQGGADMLHLDIMDGHFVPNLTFGLPVVTALARHCRIPLDAHLMVTNPDPMIGQLAAAGVARISVHIETCTHLNRTLDLIRSEGLEAGVAINPGSSLSLLEEVYGWIDFVLLMSVNPGFGGQQLIPESYDKLQRLRRAAGDGIDITVDGGVDATNAGRLTMAGATSLVAGSSVYGQKNRAAAISQLRQAATEGDEK